MTEAAARAGRDEPDGLEGAARGEPAIRLMRAFDLRVVSAIDRAAGGRERTEYLEGRIAACLEAPGINTSLIAEVEGVAAGFLMGRMFFGEFGIPTPRAVLDAIGVRPDFSGQGVGHALLEQYRRNLTALRVEAIDTLVDWRRTELLGFFAALGFRPSRNVDLVWEIGSYPFGGGNPEVRVRFAKQEHLVAVTAMDQQTGLPPRSFYYATKLEAAREAREKNIFVVAELDGVVAGYMVGSLYGGEFGIDEARGVIDSMGVAEAFRHRGVGSAIMVFLLERLEQLGVGQMETLCRWNDWEALRFFEYVGFRPTPRINLEWKIA